MVVVVVGGGGGGGGGGIGFFGVRGAGVVVVVCFVFGFLGRIFCKFFLVAWCLFLFWVFPLYFDPKNKQTCMPFFLSISVVGDPLLRKTV